MNYKLIAYSQDFSSFLLEKLGDESNKISQIILFGSVARGQAKKNSDIDVFVEVIDQSLEKKIKDIKEMFYDSVKMKNYWELLGIKNEFHLIIGKIEEWDDLRGSLIANGITLYGKYKSNPKLEHFYLFLVNTGAKRSKNVSIWRSLYGYKQKVGKKLYKKEGLVSQYNGKKLARGVFTIPSEHASKIILFLKKNNFRYKIIQSWQEAA